MAKTTLGVIISTRSFFPSSLVPEARDAITAVLKTVGAKGIMLSTTDTRLGAVETRADAKVCADLFKKHRDEISGIVVVLPNFGDERGVAEAIRMSGLDVPVLVQAYPDDSAESTVNKRRDAFCGKVSVCNNLVQQGTRFTLTTGHTVRPEDKTFEADLQDFVAVCRVVRGMKTARIGAIGARPAAFRTVRYSEKVLEGQGISVETVDLSEIFGWAERLADKDRRVIHRANAFRKYADTTGVPKDKIVRMAKLAVVVDDWVKTNDLDATAIQCWTSLQENYGVASCALMSMMSEGLRPSACEVDVTGALSMYALTLASGGPAALADWNNNYQDDPDKCVFFHCGNWPKSFCAAAKMSYLEIVGKTMGPDRCWGSIVGRAAEGPLTFARLSTDESSGEIVGYVGEGEFAADALETFGAYGVVNVQNLQGLMRMICRAGFEHHVAFCRSFVADIVHEALGNYLGWSVYTHS
jgi:L-fucose isomerase-like protein